MTTTALMILNPREIPYCMKALRSLRVPKFWASYMYEPQAALAVNKAILDSNFDRYVLISDDCEPTQEALDKVLALHDDGIDVATGYSNFDAYLPFVNLCWNALEPPPPGLYSYGFFTRAEIDTMIDGVGIPTTFTGLSFTCMSRDMWLRFPLHVTSAGGQMDYQLSWELQEAGVPIYAAPGAFVLHHKDKYGVYPDSSPEKQLLVGVRPAAMTWTDLDLTEAA